MSILPAQTIRFLCKKRGMVSPYCERTAELGMTYGLSPAGYDVRIAESCQMEPGEFMLASTVERFDIPDDVLARVCDKSSWARMGLALQNTVIEPGWRGYLTLELTNHSSKAISIASGSPIAQILFERLEAPTHEPYSGRYQDQEPGAQTAIIIGA